jgi:DNA-binding response OmpR family regulator
LILLVDDDPAALRSVRRILESAGMRVEAFSDPEQALDHSAGEEPELILYNLHLPAMSGVDFRAAYLGRFPMRRTPLAFLSDLSGSTDMANALEAGADDYFVKPLEPELFVARVRVLLRRRREGLSARFRGDLSRFSLVQVLQYCEKHKISGPVRFETAKGTVSVMFDAGEMLVDQDDDLLAEVMSLEEGSFIIESLPAGFGEIADAYKASLPPPQRGPADDLEPPSSSSGPAPAEAAEADDEDHTDHTDHTDHAEQAEQAEHADAGDDADEAAAADALAAAARGSAEPTAPALPPLPVLPGPVPSSARTPAAPLPPLPMQPGPPPGSARTPAAPLPPLPVQPGPPPGSARTPAAPLPPLPAQPAPAPAPIRAPERPALLEPEPMPASAELRGGALRRAPLVIPYMPPPRTLLSAGPLQAPMGRLSGVEHGDRMFQLQTEYEAPPVDEIVTIVIVNGRVVKKHSTPRPVGADGDALRSLLEEQHTEVEHLVRSKLLAAAQDAQEEAMGYDAQTLFDRGLQKWREGDLVGALRLLERAQRLNPDDRALGACVESVRRRAAKASRDPFG